MQKKYLLFAPGPSPIPPNVLLAMAEPIIHHRAPAYIKVLEEVRELGVELAQTFQGRSSHELRVHEPALLGPVVEPAVLEEFAEEAGALGIHGAVQTVFLAEDEARRIAK